jgi:Fic family protein
MRWNWTQPDWPNFRYDSAAVEPLERRFLLSSGEILGAVRHVTGDERDRLRIELLSEEAMRTSAIEGEVLDRSSVQSSLRRQFGLTADGAPSKPREQGVAEMMVDVYSTYAAPLTHDTLCRWHGMLLSHDRGLETIGAYRRHDDAMQIVSGRIDRPTVHFEAPPSAQVRSEMDVFVDWFNRTAPDGSTPLPALTRAALGHLWFESIHPFEDGNGRLGRALAEKSLAQNIGQPSLIALAYTIERDRKVTTTSSRPTRRRWMSRLAALVRRDRSEGAAGDADTGRLLHRQGEVLRPVPRPAERPAGQGDRAHVPRGARRVQRAASAPKTTLPSPARRARPRPGICRTLVEMGALNRTGERRHTRYWLRLR